MPNGKKKTTGPGNARSGTNSTDSTDTVSRYVANLRSSGANGNGATSAHAMYGNNRHFPRLDQDDEMEIQTPSTPHPKITDARYNSFLLSSQPEGMMEKGGGIILDDNGSLPIRRRLSDERHNQQRRHRPMQSSVLEGEDGRWSLQMEDDLMASRQHQRRQMQQRSGDRSYRSERQSTMSSMPRPALGGSLMNHPLNDGALIFFSDGHPNSQSVESPLYCFSEDDGGSPQLLDREKGSPLAEKYNKQYSPLLHGSLETHLMELGDSEPHDDAQAMGEAPKRRFASQDSPVVVASSCVALPNSQIVDSTVNDDPWSVDKKSPKEGDAVSNRSSLHTAERSPTLLSTTQVPLLATTEPTFGGDENPERASPSDIESHAMRVTKGVQHWGSVIDEYIESQLVATHASSKNHSSDPTVLKGNHSKDYRRLPVELGADAAAADTHRTTLAKEKNLNALLGWIEENQDSLPHVTRNSPLYQFPELRNSHATTRDALPTNGAAVAERPIPRVSLRMELGNLADDDSVVKMFDEPDKPVVAIAGGDKGNEKQETTTLPILHFSDEPTSSGPEALCDSPTQATRSKPLPPWPRQASSAHSSSSSGDLGKERGGPLQQWAAGNRPPGGLPHPNGGPNAEWERHLNHMARRPLPHSAAAPASRAGTHPANLMNQGAVSPPMPIKPVGWGSGGGADQTLQNVTSEGNWSSGRLERDKGRDVAKSVFDVDGALDVRQAVDGLEALRRLRNAQRPAIH